MYFLKNLISIILFIFLLSLFPANGFSQDVYLNPKPQSYTNTCQSYALAMALIKTGDSKFVVEKTKELREFEIRIRNIIESIAKKDKKSVYSHAVWAKAVTHIAINKYKLKSKTTNDLEEYYRIIEEITGQASVKILGPIMSAVLSQKVVLTSVKRIGENNYGSGHIVALFGVGAATPHKSELRSLAILNSAIKVNDKFKNACSIDDKVGDYKYSALVSLVKDYELKKYSGKYKLMWIE